MTNKNQKRTALPKSLRFEVLKLHKFKCQYCGAAAPEVLLHIDHIKPVSQGGTNDFTNLTVACAACNLGKGKIELDDKSRIQKSRISLEELQERQEQVEMMMEWQYELKNLKENTVDKICEYWQECAPGLTINENGKQDLKKLLHKYSIDEIVQAMDIASDQYLEFKEDGAVTTESWEIGFSKIRGICHVNRQSKDDPEYKDLLYIRGIARKRCEKGYFNNGEAFSILKNAKEIGVPLSELTSLAKNIRSWTQFRKGVGNLIEEYK